MNISVKDLFDYKIRATDGEIGHVHDVLFDDRSFDLRYFVVDTGGWLLGRKVLIAPVAAEERLAPLAADAPDPATKMLPVRLTRDQVKNAPDLRADLPLDRAQEVDYHNHFDWRYYWLDPTLSTGNIIQVPPAVIENGQRASEEVPVPSEKRDPELRSARDFQGYTLEYNGMPAGEVVDLILDDARWCISYAVVKLSEHSDDKMILLPVENLGRITSPEKEASIDLPIGVLFDAPAYNQSSLRDGALFARVREYYSHQVPIGG